MHWTGPGYRRDTIALAHPEDRTGHQADYAHTASGNPAVLTIPAKPGTYELRYIMDGPEADVVLARRPLVVQ